ncbi:MAG: hypothetical protein Q3976_04180 [Corynebacterium sp.]|nr:hypothetical protein [Corynebacterium sp.]
MSEFKEAVTADNRDKAVNDVANALEETIDQLSGLTGKAVKLGYAAAKKKRPDIAIKIADTMLESLCDTLDPYWSDYKSDSGSDFGAYLVEHKDEVSRDVLKLADEKVAEIDNDKLTKGHERFRNKAVDYAEISLPALGKALEQNARSSTL